MKRKNIILTWILWSFFLSSSTFASVDNANYLAWKGIISDKSKNVSEYRLNNNILRQEVAVIALWVHGWSKLNYCSGIFRDVSNIKPNTWACQTIEALEKYDIISDDNLYFNPEKNITKAEVLWMLVKAAFNDEYESVKWAWNWQKQVVDFAVSKGIISNFTDYNSKATRSFVFDTWANILKYKNWEKIVQTNNQNTNSKKIVSNQITKEEAKNIALKNAWLSENQTSWLIIKNDYERWILFYEIEFFQKNTTKKWEYKISSINWQIVEYDIDYNDFD